MERYLLEIQADCTQVNSFIYDADISLKEDLTEEELDNLDVLLQTEDYIVASCY